MTDLQLASSVSF